MKKDDVILATYAFAAPSPIPQVDLYPRRKRLELDRTGKAITV